MIGYYIHHVGHGHLHRATAVARALAEPVTGFSSLSAPKDWPGPWIQLDRDDEDVARDRTDQTARERLHWVPLGHHGLGRGWRRWHPGCATSLPRCSLSTSRSR